MDSLADQSNQENHQSIEFESNENVTGEETTVGTTESEQTDLPTTGNINEEISATDTTNLIHAEPTFPEGVPGDLSLGTPHSSVARILVKPGQIFRVQVDNEVKEVHGKLFLQLIEY